jgi:hypothetical protein
MKITGLSQEWRIDLDMQWTRGTKRFEFRPNGATGEFLSQRDSASPETTPSNEPDVNGAVTTNQDVATIAQAEVVQGIEKPKDEGDPANIRQPRNRKTAKKRGRRPNPDRRDAIGKAIEKHGEEWRDHLGEIFAELDRQNVPLGDFQSIKVDVGDGQSAKISSWDDLDLAEGEQRRQILDTLRKYTG